MEISVLEVKNKKAYFVRGGTLNGNNIILNGITLDRLSINMDMIITFNDVLQFLPNSKKLIEYRKGDKSITIEDWNLKPQYYDRDDSDEYVLRAIANKKELEGFEPHYQEQQPENINFKVVGYIEDTGSLFIDCTISDKWNKLEGVFTINGNKISLDEYKKCVLEYSDHAKFEKLDRNYLRFAKINNSYAFNDYYPFGDNQYRRSFTNLVDAQIEEKNIRNIVREQIKKSVFKAGLTDEKKIQILSSLKHIKKMKKKEYMDNMLSILIDDLNNYNIELK